MRTLRGLLLCAAALAGILPATAEAQQGRRFENAWFWGLKGGGMLYAHAPVASDGAGGYGAYAAQNRHAPTVGLDWLITRRRGGLYVSYEQSFLDETTGYVDGMDPAAPVVAVNLDDVRRVNLAGVFFPPVTRWVQPYFGLGASFLQVAGTETVNPDAFADASSAAAFEAFIAEQRSQFQPLGIVGVQARLAPFSVFVQGTATRFDQRDFLLRGGRSAVVNYEVGIRYNIGSAIERP